MNKVMKANAPKKIYIFDNPILDFTKLSVRQGSDDIEYVRKDAFIEKAVKWLSANADKYIWYSDYAENIGDDTCGMNDDFMEDFKKYMKD